jgi:hypothetical protein
VAQPNFVPTDPTEEVRRYQSPPRRPDSWRAGRPGDLGTPQPWGEQLGNPGPDQGYALKLVREFDGRLHLGRVDHDDAVAGCVAVAMKRSALFGRAPVIHDLTAAFTIFGFLDPDPPADLVAFREPLFAEVHSSHHYRELRTLVDLVPVEVLRTTPGAIAADHAADWRRNLSL